MMVTFTPEVWASWCVDTTSWILNQRSVDTFINGAGNEVIKVKGIIWWKCCCHQGTLRFPGLFHLRVLLFQRAPSGPQHLATGAFKCKSVLIKVGQAHLELANDICITSSLLNKNFS